MTSSPKRNLYIGGSVLIALIIILFLLKSSQNIHQGSR